MRSSIYSFALVENGDGDGVGERERERGKGKGTKKLIKTEDENASNR